MKLKSKWMNSDTVEWGKKCTLSLYAHCEGNIKRVKNRVGHKIVKCE